MAPDEVHQSTAPSTTYFHIPGLGKSYKVGEELRVTVVARDFHQKPKQYGGDYFQAKLFSSKLKASVFGEVTDLENGSYSVHFLLPWSGEARVAVRLIHSSEAVQVLKQLRKYQSDRVYFKGLFVGTGLNGEKLKETMECNSKWDGAGLERMQKSNCCMKYINLHSAEQAGPLLAVDVENNIVLHWRAHGTPLRSKAAPFVDLHYISNEIDSIAGGSRKVIIFNIWAHFTTHPLEYYIRRVARIRQAVIALLKRAPDTIVAIKSANTGSKPVADIGMAPHEVHQIQDLLHWPGPDKQIEDFLQSTTPSNTYFYIPGLGKSYKVGEELRVTVVARDFHQKPKQYGGDYFQAKLFSSKLKASVFGEVTDLENGSYSVRFLLPWSGEAWVAVRLIHSSEAVQVLKQLRKYQSDRVYFKGLFVGTDPKTGEVWLCKRPKYLPCDALVYHVVGGYRAKLGTLQNKLLGRCNREMQTWAANPSPSWVLHEGRVDLSGLHHRPF
ncbi:hypothetical protein COCON_G00003730 [Conger conger]|uniref:NXPE C-terminal domain-containing protein n=1 Tax=Conger conger TaxID=82655 RepID=A0A9Q1I7I3_CONCO|nr:hypothetical protein COCON_G00003730 [Conger conger]